MSGAGPRRVVVVGRDAPLWLAARVLDRALRPLGAEVAAVELPSALGAASVHATLPPLEALHARLGMAEGALLRDVGGCLSFGQNLVGFGAGEGDFLHAWSDHGAPIDGLTFLGHWLRARAGGLPASLQDFSPGAVAAKNGRVMIADEEVEAYGRCDYGYHLPAVAYAALLKRDAAARGVGRHETTAVSIEPETAGATVVLDGGTVRLAADLVVDARGEARPVEEGAGAPLGGVRRVLRALGPRLPSLPPYADVRADPDGWTSLHPCQDGTRIVRVGLAGVSDEEMTSAANRAAGMALSGVTVETATPGMAAVAWSGSVVRVGGAYARLDPLMVDELLILQIGLVNLLSLLPAGPDASAEREEYDRAMRSHVGRVADFQQAVYRAAGRAGPFWDAARASPVDPAVAHKLRTFAVRGEVPPMEDETFSPASWQMLLVGLGVVPSSWPPAVERTDSARLRDELRRMLAFVAGKVRAAPTHDEYLAGLARGRAA